MADRVGDDQSVLTKNAGIVTGRPPILALGSAATTEWRANFAVTAQARLEARGGEGSVNSDPVETQR